MKVHVHVTRPDDDHPTPLWDGGRIAGFEAVFSRRTPTVDDARWTVDHRDSPPLYLSRSDPVAGFSVHRTGQR